MCSTLLHNKQQFSFLAVAFSLSIKCGNLFVVHLANMQKLNLSKRQNEIMLYLQLAVFTNCGLHL